jgi:hypothetical protein
LNRISIAQEIRARIDKWNCTSKEMIMKVKRQLTEQKRIFAVIHLTKLNIQNV